MGIVVSSKRGAVSDPNIVPLIDILLVLLVIFMVIPHSQGLRAEIPQACQAQEAEACSGGDKTGPVVIQVLADGSLRINQESVALQYLDAKLTEVFKVRAARKAFIWGDASVQFATVAQVIDVMQTEGIASIGLLTQPLGNGF